MTQRRYLFALVVSIAALCSCGCRRNIVLAGPPASVATPPPAEPVVQPAATPQPAEPKSDASAPAEAVPAPALEPAPSPAANPAPARPRPAVEPEAPKPKSEPEEVPAPQIAPQLPPQQLAETERTTNDEIRVAESNLQHATGQKLNASQADLFDKIRGFLDEAHDAIKASDWVRAQNLAQKAEVLSAELVKSF